MSTTKTDRCVSARELDILKQIDHLRREWALLRLRLSLICTDVEVNNQVSRRILEAIEDCDIETI